jgi:DNA primase
MTKLADFLQQLRNRLPLSVVVARHLSIKKKGREFSGLCPFHNEKSPSFTINDEKEFYYCFGCGARGDHVNFIMNKLNVPFMESVTYLAEQAGLEVPKFDRPNDEAPESNSQEVFSKFYEINEAATQWYQNQLRTSSAGFVRDYLKNRGMSGDIAYKFRIGYAPERGLKEFLLKKGFSLDDIKICGLVIEPEDHRSPYDRFRSRVMFPIQDQRGRVIAFGGRVIQGGEPKYLNSPDTPIFHKGKLLYGFNHALPTVRSKRDDSFPFVVVEGYMDVISLHQAGITSAVAPLGTALTNDQIALMWRACPQPILCFDGDAAGRRAAHRAMDRVLELLRPGGYTLEFCFLPEGEDPDSFVQKSSGATLRGHLTRSLSLADVLWQAFMEQRPLVTPEQKVKARKDLLDLTTQIHDPELRHFYREDLNTRLQQKLQTQREPQNWKGKIGGLRQDFPQRNLIQKQVLGQEKNKFVIGEKILLATLINHPTLISEVAEQLTAMPTSEKGGMGTLSTLREVLLEFCIQWPEGDSNQLKSLLENKGLSFLVRDLLTNDLHNKARIVHPSTPLDQVLKGWQEIWQSIQINQHIGDEVKLTSSELKSSLDQKSWKRLKLLKENLIGHTQLG